MSDGASPQVEDGFTRIANELFDAIVGAGFTKREMLVMLTIVRKTYGYNKKTDDMTVTQIADYCGMDRASISKALASLVRKNAVTKRHGRHGYVLGIQKKYKNWKACQNVTPVTKRHGGRDKTSRKACQNVTHKRQPQKTTPKDKGRAREKETPPPPGLNLKAWADWVDYRRARRLAKYKPATAARQQKALAALEADQQQACVDESVRQNWQGLFPDKPKYQRSAGTSNVVTGVSFAPTYGTNDPEG